MTDAIGLPVAEHRRLLRQLLTLIEGRESDLIDRFYRWLEATPEFAAYLPRGPALTALKAAQRAYFHELLEANFDERYRAARVEVGRTHYRVGLPQRLYTASYQLYLDLLMEEVAEVLADSPDLGPTTRALFHAVMYDVGLVQEGWTEAHTRTEVELEEAQRALETSRRMDAVGQLAAELAHDLNNVLGTLSTALHPLRSVDGIQEEVSLIAAASLRGQRMARRLLGIARRPDEPSDPIDIFATVRAFRPLLEHMLVPGMRLRTEVPHGTAAVVIDPDELERAIMNLVLNAQSAISPPSEIVLRVVRRELPPGPAGTPSGLCICIEVTDRGCGMTDDVLARVFEPLFTTRAGGSGTGLGLAQVWTTARSAGGIARCRSRLGEGSTFEIFLPLAPNRARLALARSQPVPVVPGQGESVLLVEDDHMVARATARLLRGSGYGVRVASTAAAALQEVTRKTPDVLLTDCLLPDRSGIELVLELTNVVPRLKMLIRTGLSPAKADPTGLLPKHIPILEKTASPATLLRALREALTPAR